MKVLVGIPEPENVIILVLTGIPGGGPHPTYNDITLGFFDHMALQVHTQTSKGNGAARRWGSADGENLGGKNVGKKLSFFDKTPEV